MIFYSIMQSILHLGKMARTSAKSENRIDTMRFLRYLSRVFLARKKIFVTFAIFADISGPFLVSSFSKCRILLNL